MYTVEFYNKKTGDVLCYVKKTSTNFPYVDNSYLTKYIDKSEELNDKEILIKYAGYVIERAFGSYDNGSMSEHEYNHMKKDYFDSVREKNVGFRVFNKVQEIRKRKINKIKKED